MTVIKWDPVKNIVLLQDRINRLFNDAFPLTHADGEELSENAWRPSADIYETPEGIVIQMDLPGVEKQDVNVEIKNNRLIIQGSRPAGVEIAREAYYRRERLHGPFQRSFALRTTVSPDGIKASFKNGVLTIVIPNPGEEKPKKISVNID